jgi:predicted ATPase
MPTFVGRSAELGLLQARFAEAAAGRPRTVVLEGPAGVGKSALLHAFVGSLDPATVLAASGDEAETFLQFGALRQLLGSRSGTWPDPFAAGGHVLEILDQRHREQPTVFVIDDAHLADTASLTALTFALRRLQADRVLAVFVVRDTDVARIPAGLLRLA